MSFETRKAMKRRWAEDDAGIYPWREWMSGEGIDIGCGPDKVPLTNFRGFDLKDGDANKFSSYFQPEQFDVIHSSQCLEHMHDPAGALRDWFRALKVGGRMIASVPSWELYERMVWPSKYNPDHKSTWSMWQPGSPAPHHVKLPEWLDQFEYDVKLCRLVDTNFDYTLASFSRDQTWRPEDEVECWLEFVLIKK